ncbi:glycosyltransferase family 4 protein [Photobacterium carnosum]|uniref:glycosyltransferase family 4 protein n=1 Tax=Photobacterium carnosum TaxID=2023717 RepID=UPI001F3822F4|nr:glycosyltransferase family 4 protein [Photobacterium carnosum]
MNKKILHIINKLEIGGVEVGVLNLLLNSKSNNYTVLCVKGVDNDLYNSLPHDKRKNIIICNGYLSSLLTVRKENFNIIVSSLWRSHFVSLALKIFNTKAKYIHFVHSTKFEHLIDKIVTKISRHKADYLITDSEETKNSISNNVKETFVCPMNVSFLDENFIKKSDMNKMDFVYVGRFDKCKNIKLSIDFIEKLYNKGLKVKFDIYGRDSGDKLNLINYINDKKLNKIITFKGEIMPHNVEYIMSSYNFYLQTSEYEGMALSVYQALNVGLLPLVTPVGEISNYTKNRYNAIYINKSDLDATVKVFISDYESEFIGYKIGAIRNKLAYLPFHNTFFSIISTIRN